MVELWKSYNELRQFLAGKKTYITATAMGILGALQVAGYPIPQWIWPIVTALLGDAVKAAVDKWKSVDIENNQ